MKFKLFTLIVTLVNITLSKVWISQVCGQNTSDTEIKTYIEQLETNPNWKVRSQAAKALGKFNQNPDIVIPVLIAALEDTDEVVRLRATFSLMEIGPPAAPQLVDALGTENESALASAKFALRSMGMSIAPTLSNALSSYDRQVRSSAASIFQEMAADIERRPISKAASLSELKQVVSYLEEAVRDMEGFIKESVGGYEREDVEAIRKSMVVFKSEIRGRYLSSIFHVCNRNFLSPDASWIFTTLVSPRIISTLDHIHTSS